MRQTLIMMLVVAWMTTRGGGRDQTYGSWWWWLEPLLMLAGTFGILLLSLLMNQSKMLYVPVCQTHEDFPAQSPKLSANHPDFLSPLQSMKHRDLYLETEDGIKVHAWLFPSKHHGEEEDDTVLIYLHGNAGNIGHRIQTWQAFHEHLPDFALLCLDYRGYGNSEGEPSEQGLVLDCQACLAYANQKYARVILLGTSLGAAVAVAAITSNEDEAPLSNAVVHACILENGFTSVCDVACTQLPILLPFKPVLSSELGSRLFLTNVFDTRRRLQQGGASSSKLPPLLFLRGELDEIVPPAHSLELYNLVAATQCRAALYTFRDAGHNDLADIGQQSYFQAIKDFV